MKKKQIGIIGATGFTGSELVRILYNHPQIEIALITSESKAGERFSDVHPFFKDIANHELVSAQKIDDYNLDLVFLALPHGVSMDYVERYKDHSFKIIDLSGDFRLNTPATYNEWYKKEHTFEEGFKDAAYGIPELFKEKIKKWTEKVSEEAETTSKKLEKPAKKKKSEEKESAEAGIINN